MQNNKISTFLLLKYSIPAKMEKKGKSRLRGFIGLCHYSGLQLVLKKKLKQN